MAKEKTAPALLEENQLTGPFIYESIQNILQEHKVNEAFLLREVCSGIQEAICANRKRTPLDPPYVHIDKKMGTVTATEKRIVVSEIMDPETDILLQDALLYDLDADVGKMVEVPIDLEKHRRLILMALRRVTVQAINYTLHEQIYRAFASKERTVVIGKILTIDPDTGHAHILLKNEGMTIETVLYKEKVAQYDNIKDSPYIRVFLSSVLHPDNIDKRTFSGTHLEVPDQKGGYEALGQVRITDIWSPGCVIATLKAYVPEVANGTIEVVGVARVPKKAALVALHSDDPGIDPVMAVAGGDKNCSARLRDIFDNEKVSFFAWSSDPVKCLRNILKNIEISAIRENVEESEATGRRHEATGRRHFEIYPRYEADGITLLRSGAIMLKMASALTGCIFHVPSEVVQRGRVISQNQMPDYMEENPLSKEKQERLLAIASDQIGTVYKGTVTRVDEQTSFVYLRIDFGELFTETILPPRDRVKGFKYIPGESIFVQVTKAYMTEKGPAITVSHNSEGVLMHYLELAIPEIRSGTVEVKALARVAGVRAAVAVISNSPDVNAISACIGVGAEYTKWLSEELRGEKVSFFPWSEDKEQMIQTILYQGRISTIIQAGQDKYKVYVPEEDVHLMIGSGGCNARLVARLTGAAIDILPDEILNQPLDQLPMDDDEEEEEDSATTQRSQKKKKKKKKR